MINEPSKTMANASPISVTYTQVGSVRPAGLLEIISAHRNELNEAVGRLYGLAQRINPGSDHPVSDPIPEKSSGSIREYAAECQSMATKIHELCSRLEGDL